MPCQAYSKQCQLWRSWSRLESSVNLHDDRDTLHFLFCVRLYLQGGGISDRPGDMCDPFHTLFGIAGVSLLGADPRLQEVNPVLCMPESVVQRTGLKLQVLVWCLRTHEHLFLAAADVILKLLWFVVEFSYFTFFYSTFHFVDKNFPIFVRHHVSMLQNNQICVLFQYICTFIDLTFVVLFLPQCCFALCACDACVAVFCDILISSMRYLLLLVWPPVHKQTIFFTKNA